LQPIGCGRAASQFEVVGFSVILKEDDMNNHSYKKSPKIDQSQAAIRSARKQMKQQIGCARGANQLDER
jgi:hypothetical protein